MKCSVEQYIISLCDIRCGRNAIESFCHRKSSGGTVLCEAMIYNIVTKLNYPGLVLNENKFRSSITGAGEGRGLRKSLYFGSSECAVHVVVGRSAVFPRSPGWSRGIQASSEGGGTIKYKVVLKITINKFNNIMKTRKQKLSRRQIQGEQLKYSLQYLAPFNQPCLKQGTLNYINYALPRHLIQRLKNEYNTKTWPFKNTRLNKQTKLRISQSLASHTACDSGQP
jgi:hypothetical protein